MCSGFVLGLFGHRQGRRGKASIVSVDRVGGSTKIGGGADRGVAIHARWHQQLWCAWDCNWSVFGDPGQQLLP